MKISEKIVELSKRAQDAAFPNAKDNDYAQFVTLTICPIDGGGFQVWFDKWDLNGPSDPTHLGTLCPFVEGKTISKALNAMDLELADYEEEHPAPPQMIHHNGYTYQLVK